MASDDIVVKYCNACYRSYTDRFYIGYPPFCQGPYHQCRYSRCRQHVVYEKGEFVADKSILVLTDEDKDKIMDLVRQSIRSPNVKSSTDLLSSQVHQEELRIAQERLEDAEQSLLRTLEAIRHLGEAVQAAEDTRAEASLRTKVVDRLSSVLEGANLRDERFLLSHLRHCLCL